MWQALNFLPDPHGQGSLRPTFFARLRTGSRFFSGECWLPAMAASCCWRTPPGAGVGGELRLGLVVDGLGAVELPLRAEVVEKFGVELFDAEDQVGDAVADAVPHLGEDPHPFPLVLDLGIDLGVALQADRAAEVVHGPQVFHPARIEDLEQDGFFHLAHLGPLLGVEGVEAACGGPRPRTWTARSSALISSPRDCWAQAGEFGQGRGIGVASPVLVGGWEPVSLAAASLASSSWASLAPW